MTITTTPTPPRTTQPPPMSRHATRRLLWATLAFTLGGIFGVGVTLAADDSSDRGDTRDLVPDAVPGPVARSAASPSISADAMDRVALHRQAAACTRLPTSADAAERCLTAGG